MHVIKIPKGRGKWRVVYSPGRKQRRRLNALLPELQAAERRAAMALGTQDVAHGFIRGRGPVTCAQAHRGQAVTVSMDLAGWFDSVRPDQIAEGLTLAGGWSREQATAMAQDVCAVGCPESPRPGELAPRQGLPTSPTAANLAAVRFDRLILDALAQLGAQCVYTRYADDLVVSCQDEGAVGAIQAALESAAMAMGWTIAPGKSRAQRARHGRRVIVGIAVDDYCYPTRRVRRKLRAAQHQDADSPSARGLAEWCLLRRPKPVPSS